MTAASRSVSQAPHRFGLWIILAAQLMLQMDFLIVLVALPQIQADLGFSAAGLSWVVADPAHCAHGLPVAFIAAAVLAALASLLAWFGIQDAEVKTSGVKPGAAGHL